MKKIYIDKDEWYPVYFPWEKRHWSAQIEVEVKEDFIKKCEKVMKAFDEMQEKLENLYEKTKTKSEEV